MNRRIRSISAMLVALAFATQAAANDAPVAEDIKVTELAGTEVRVGLVASDANIVDGYYLSYRITTPPGVGKLVPLYPDSDNPRYDAYKEFLPPAGWHGTTTFKYQAYDGAKWSNTATGTITLTPGTAPRARYRRVTMFTGITSPRFRHPYEDPDDLQTMRFTLVTQPKHGTIETHESGAWYTYTSDPGYTGTDSFTWKVNDGVFDSEVATTRIQVRKLGDIRGDRIDVVVDQARYAELKSRVDRLVADLGNDGYNASLHVFANSSARDLWDRFQRLYHEEDLVGAILIGAIPKPGGAYDKNYHFLDRYRTGSHYSDNPDIWVSRFASTNIQQLTNALDANHYARTGQSRVPLTAWYSVNDEFGNAASSPSQLEQVWPEVKAYEIDGGQGDFLVPMQDGGDFGIRDNHGTPRVGMGPHNLRVAFIDGCQAAKGNGVNNVQNYQFSYGGNNLLSIGATENMGPHGFDPSGWLGDPYYGSIGGGRMLTAGESWGQLLLQGLYNEKQFQARFAHYFGDLTVGVSQGPGNLVPKIASAKLSTAKPIVGQSFTITCTIDDADAGSSDSPHLPFEFQADFWSTDVDISRRKPSQTITGNTLDWQPRFSHSYSKPHNYSLRVEVMDEWRARRAVVKKVTVCNDPTKAFRINCAAEKDLQDPQGRTWWHGQDDQGGWGVSGDQGGKTSNKNNPVKKAVAGSDFDELYHTFRNVAKSWKDQFHRIPVKNGSWKVTLHFADMMSSDKNQRLLDAWLEDQQILDRFDCYAEVGAKTACAKTFTVTVSDGRIDLALRKHADSPKNAFISGISIEPVGGGTITRSILLQPVPDHRWLILEPTDAMTAPDRDGFRVFQVRPGESVRAALDPELRANN